MKNIYNRSIAGSTARALGKMMFLFLTLILFNHLSYGQATQLSPIGSTLADITDRDDFYQEVSLTSTFSGGIQFGATVYTSMFVGSNGYVTFGVGNSSYNPTGIAGYSAGPIIAAQYDDLHPGIAGDIYYSQNGSYLVVTFLGVAPYGSPPMTGSGVNTFQIVLRQGAGYNGTSNRNFHIEVRYINMNWAGSSNVSPYWPTAGWSTGTMVYGEMPYSGTSSFLLNQSSSNIGQPGIYSWEVLGGTVQSAPTVNITNSVTSITGNSGFSGGNITADGGLPVTERGLAYSTSPNPTISNSTVTSGTGTGSFTATMTGLNAGTTYYVRAYALNSIGPGYGPQVSFTTTSCGNPTNGGSITGTQSGCAPFTPATISSTALPTGHIGTLEYRWQSSTTGSGSGFSDISSSNSASYSPGALSQTTWFKRIARVTCATWTGAAESNVIQVTVEPTPVAGTLTKTPNVVSVCENDNVSAALTAGTGGNGTDELQYRINNGAWSAWAAYTSGSNISTTGLTGVEIRTRRTASICSSTAYTTVSWSVEATPVAGTLTKTPNVLNVCENDIVSAIFTSGAGGNGIDQLEVRTNNGSWSAWTAYTSGTNISTTGLSGVEIRTRRTASTCASTAYVTVTWNVEGTSVAGTLTKSPNVMNVCENDNVSATLSAGTGGNGTDELQYRTNNGTWSAWAAYTSASNISTTGLSGVEIRTRRMGTHCVTSGYSTVSWSIEPTPVAGSLIKNPNENTVCEGELVSALFTSGSNGNGLDELEYRTRTGATWSIWVSYTSGNQISTNGRSGVEIRTRRLASTCSPSAYVTVNWIVEAHAVAGSILKTPDNYNVCEGDFVSALLMPGTGGNGSDNLDFRTNNGSTWTSWSAYTQGTNISTSGIHGVEMRTRRNATYCDHSTYSYASWLVEQTPVNGILVKNPDAMGTCISGLVSAILIPGEGGNGIDELQYRSSVGSSWSIWMPYTSGNSIAATGKSGIEIRTRRAATYCATPTYSTISWSVELTPIAGSLTKSPEVMNVCENDIVSATLTSGAGGNGIDELEFRTNNGAWSAWAAYTSGTDISTADLSGVEIRTRRTSSYCESTAYVTVSWTVEATPVAGTLAKTPNVLNVCENDIVSAILTAGNGGNGIDELEFRINDGIWSDWAAYTSGTNISTADLSGVEIRTRRTASFCLTSAYTTVSWTVEATPIAGTLVKTPNALNVCENDIVSAIFTAGHGGNGIDELEFRTNNGVWSTWAAYTSGTNISTADLSGVEIRTRRTATYCENSAYVTVSWTVEATPITGTLAKTPNVLNVCENDIVSAILTSGNGGNGIDELEFRTNNGGWSAWAAYTSGTNISTADLSGVEIRTRRTATYCENSAYTTVSWTVEATPIAGTLVKTPNVLNVCENDIVSAIFTAGNGGNGIDELEFRINNGGWSAWTAYTSGTNISTADLSGVEIRTRRTATYCENSAYTTVGWTVEATPIAGTLAKTPNVLNVCENDIVSAIFTAGNGGNGIDELEFRTNYGGWSAWTAYTSGTNISTADLSGVEIRTRRTATYCENSAYTTVSWTVEATPITGTLAKTPNVLNVCENDIVSAILTAGNGGNGIDELEFRTNNGAWSTWAVYTSGTNISTADLSGIEIRTRRAASYCESSAYVTVGWTVEATPIAGTLAKTPNVLNVCENDIVSAIFTAGNGGNGIDELEFRTNNGGWSTWAAYTSGTNISTADLSGVEIRTRRTATYCENSAYTTVSWTVEATPITGTLAKTPNVLNVCENDIVSAILTAGNGGNGIDELEFRTNNGAWSTWTAYTSGTNISTADLSGIEIRTRRAATYCESTAYVSVSWSVEATPIAGLLTKTPNVLNVCENDIVSAIFTAGNGGNGIDELEFRTNNGGWTTWAAYTSGTNISTADLSGVEIRTRRTATFCSASAYTTVSWTVEATPLTGTLAKTPNELNVCENDIVSAILTAGNGGNGIDELEFRTNDGTWSDWAAYTSGANISTADLSGVEIRTRRAASYCENSVYVTVGWTVEATPIAGTLAKTPNVLNVCENDIVSAILTSGNGGNGIDELEFRTNDGTWSIWAAYTSGTEISTADLSGVEIRTHRTASYCESSAYVTVSWTVEATPIAGLLTKTPDVDNVCIGELVSAAFTPGSGGNGTDFLEYRTHDGSAWTDWSTYISGTSINTTTFTSVEIRTWRTATYCENSAFNVVSWDVNPYTVGGVVEGPEGVCYGINSTILLATGYTGSIVMWQSSTNHWATITNIPNTQPTLLVENLTVTTQFRTVVQSGSCGQLFSIAAEIGVDPIPAPFIAGAGSVCDLNEIYEYATEPDMVDYQWSVSSGQIISGQGSNLVTVQWSGTGNQSISVDYQTVFGCTMPEPFTFAVELLTPETPAITIEGFLLTSSATEGNQWYLNGTIIEGATSQTYEVTENGDYTCVVTLNDCSSEVSNTITVLNVGTDPSLSFSMDVYPVPNQGLFTVKLLSPGSSNYTLTIYNALGSVVYSKESIVVQSGFSQMIDLTNSSKGIYTVVMQNENNRFIRKIVITK
jgi:uncharacterized protein YjbI with pentapeptide repeats